MARQIAFAEGIQSLFVNINDRKAIRELAAKEGANFVARGEVKILEIKYNMNVGGYNVLSQVGIEIIDVNSDEVMSSYTNTVSATAISIENGKLQSIKKAAVLAAKTLADQTINTWNDMADKGRLYNIEIRNIKNIRKNQTKPKKRLGQNFLMEEN